jgi:hypothetical protein
MANKIPLKATYSGSNTSGLAEFQSGDTIPSSYLAVDLSTLLPLAGGAMTGAITTNSTFDGVDIATRDAVLTSTTTTAGAALPKAGGTMTGQLTLAQAGLDLPVSNTYILGAGHKVLQVDATMTYFYGGSGGGQIRNADNTSTILQWLDNGKIGIGTTGGAGQLDINSGTVNTIAKFTSGDDNGFIQIEDDDTIGYVDAQNGWISIGGYAQALHTKNLSINVADGRGLSQFTAKAWVNFDGTGTPTIRDSHNIYSIGDLGTGFYQTGFTNVMSNSNFSVVASTNNWHIKLSTTNTAYARIYVAASNLVAADPSTVTAVIFGD